MEKYFRLSRAPYKDINTICITTDYRKNQGYVVSAEFRIKTSPICFGKAYCAEYYAHDGDGIAKVIPAGRKSAKKQAEADQYAEQNARSIAENYLAQVISKLKLTDDIKVEEEMA